MKDKIILTVKHGRPSTLLAYGTMKSGRLVQRRQVFKGTNPKTRVLKNQYYRTFENNNSERLIKQKNTTLENAVVIRWGSREALPTDKGTVVYNTSKAIKDATDKKKSREMFIEEGVSTPRLVTPDNIDEIERYPVIARPLVHSKGRNFVTLANRTEFLNHFNKAKSKEWYYSEFVDKEREFRVHAGHGKVLALMEKTQPGDGNIAWNRAQNDTEPFEYIKWSEVDNQNLKPVLDEGLKAIAALGLDFGGVDVMLKDGVAYVLEVNTSPTLNSSPYVAERWGKYFDWLFKQEGRRDHWDTKEMEKGSSLIWKNYQLADQPKPGK